MSVCHQIITPADLGVYKLHVTLDNSNVTVIGLHFIDGTEVERWTHSQLVDHGPQTIVVTAGQRHNVQVFATFTDPDKVTVELKLDGNSLAICELEKDGHTSSDMAIITAAVG